MPKATFFNLPEEKRQKIIDAAMDEFARQPFHKAKITSIAENAGISVGSFYQYFEDKKDLVKHILNLLAQRKLKYINQDMVVNKEKYGFFELFREIVFSGLRFARENAQYIGIASMLLADKSLQSEVLGENQDITIDFYKQLLELGLAKGELDPNIDTDLVARFLTSLSFSLIDIVYKDGTIDLDDLESGMKIMDKMLAFVENGIKRRD